VGAPRTVRAIAGRGTSARAALAFLCAVLALGAVTAAAADAVAVSTNWAGYVVSRSAGSGSGSGFSSVSGTWTVPGAACAAGRESHSAVWVGLGGANEHANGLEQVGTDADCARTGAAEYSAWYELIPAGPVNLKLSVRPGDQMTASVTVRAHDVTLRMRDLSTGARASATRHVANVDVSSAEWIVEAPSVCLAADACATLGLTDFGTVSFASATATAEGHTGPIADPAWSASALELRQAADQGFRGRPGRRFGVTDALVTATPSAVSGANSAFSVTWNEQSVQIEPPPEPTLPGFGAGAS